MSPALPRRMANWPAADRTGPPTVAVIGAGITGLAAAWELSSAPQPPRILLLEQSETVGGKLRLGDLADTQLDLGAESFLARRPEVLDLIQELGLGELLVHPEPAPAWLLRGAHRHPLPSKTLLGVPSQPESVRELLGAATVTRLQAELATSWTPHRVDLPIGQFIAERLGQDLVDRLVEPLLGGVYAGRAAELSTQASVPGLWAAAQTGQSVVAAAQAVLAAARPGPVFGGLRGGLGQLPQVLRKRLTDRGAEIYLGTPLRRISRSDPGWQLSFGRAGNTRQVQALILATPASVGGRLLADLVPSAARILRGIDYASVALITLALGDPARGLTGSGVLIPPIENRLIKAATFAGNKWGWLANGPTILRASVGRYRDSSALALDDGELVARVLADLRSLPDIQLPDPTAQLVTRWDQALPQFSVGHTERLAEVHRATATLGSVAVAGAFDGGVGIPACIASGRRAATRILTHLPGAPGTGGH